MKRNNDVDFDEKFSFEEFMDAMNQNKKLAKFILKIADNDLDPFKPIWPIFKPILINYYIYPRNLITSHY